MTRLALWIKWHPWTVKRITGRVLGTWLWWWAVRRVDRWQDRRDDIVVSYVTIRIPNARIVSEHCEAECAPQLTPAAGGR